MTLTLLTCSFTFKNGNELVIKPFSVSRSFGLIEIELFMISYCTYGTSVDIHRALFRAVVGYTTVWFHLLFRKFQFTFRGLPDDYEYPF